MKCPPETQNLGAPVSSFTKACERTCIGHPQTIILQSYNVFVFKMSSGVSKIIVERTGK